MGMKERQGWRKAGAVEPIEKLILPRLIVIQRFGVVLFSGFKQ
jgi:hypothetical protein